jgi:FMN phosphatase YigB (HAD superfamily)
MSKHEIKLVLFDLAGTLCSLSGLKEPFNSFLVDLAESLNVKVDTKTAAKYYSSSLAKSFATIGKNSYYLHSDLFGIAISEYLINCGVKDFTEGDINSALKTQRDLTVNNVKIRSGVYSTFETLKKNGIHCGIVSNIDEDYIHPMLEKLNLKDIPDFVLSSEKAKSCKPDSRIFLKAIDYITKGESQYPKILPENTLFIGDTPYADINGAKSVSMVSVLLKTNSDKSLQFQNSNWEPDYVVNSIPQILDILI